MEVDSSKQFVQKTQFPRNNWQTEKRQREPSFQYNKPQPSFQHVNKQQRVNHVDETTEIRSIYGDSLENNYDTEAEDQQTDTSELESTFLGE